MEKLSLLDFRQRLGLTQQELADRIDVSRNYIALVENGKKPFSDKLKAKLSLVNNSPSASPPLRVRDERDDAYGSPECLRRENAELRERLAGCERREAELLEIIRNLTAPGNAGRASASTEEKQS